MLLSSFLFFGGEERGGEREGIIYRKRKQKVSLPSKYNIFFPFNAEKERKTYVKRIILRAKYHLPTLLLENTPISKNVVGENEGCTTEMNCGMQNFTSCAAHAYACIARENQALQLVYPFSSKGNATSEILHTKWGTHSLFRSCKLRSPRRFLKEVYIFANVLWLVAWGPLGYVFCFLMMGKAQGSHN